eukprot:UN0426
MVLALNVSVYFCKLLPLHMNGNLPVGIGMHVFAMICDLIQLCTSEPFLRPDVSCVFTPSRLLYCSLQVAHARAHRRHDMFLQLILFGRAPDPRTVLQARGIFL